MKLSELFPDMPKVTIRGKEYPLKITTRASLQLEKDYPDKVVDDKTITTHAQVVKAVNTLLTSGIKASDLMNLLYAALIHTKAFANKDALIDATEPDDFPVYADAVFNAYVLSKATPEQLEKLDIMAETSGSKKNEPMIPQENSLSTGSSVD